MEINPLIFRAYDIRGIYGKDITEEIFQRIGFTLGQKGKKYLVGRDIRKSGKSLALALISGLLAKRAKVFYAGTGNFGKILFSGWKKKTDFTLFVTASHLPKEWNGLKIFKGDGEPIAPVNLKEKVLSVRKISLLKTKIKKINLKKFYINFLLKKFSALKNKKLKIAIDCGGGSTSLVVPEIFIKFGFRPIELFCKPDPDFSARDSEPKPEAVKKLKETVLKEKADFGVAFDGDGDRGVIIDDKGRYLRGDQVAIILAKEMFKKKKRKVAIKTVSCTIALDEELEKIGIKIIEVPVGHTFVGVACKKYRALMGVEESGHLFFPEIFPFDDAVLTPLLVIQTLIKTGKKLSQLVDNIPRYFFEEKNFECSDEKKFFIVEKLQKNFKKKYLKTSILDGIKIYFPDGWILIRASNTSPKIKFYVEAKTEDAFEKLKGEFSQILTKCIQQ